MTIATCPDLKAYLLPQNGIQCMLCGAHRVMTIQEFKGLMAKRAVHDSAINRLPVELLIEIFHHYLDMGTPTRTEDKPRVSVFPFEDTTPILLTHVCGVWRYLVQRTPTLWSSLAIYNARHKHVDLVRLWLNCAGTCPLSININHGLDEHPQRPSAEHAILNFLIDRCHSWKSIDLRLDYFQEGLMNIPTNSLKSLVHASLTLPSWPAVYHDRLWEIIYSSPKLVSVEWTCPFGQYPVHTPWIQLKTLYCAHSVPINQLLHSLQACQNLEVLVMRSGAGGIDDTVPPVQVVKLPRLKQLEIGRFDDSFSLIFEKLVAPQLTCLKLDYKYSRCSDLTPLKSFAAHSGFRLQSFELDNYHLELEDLLEWLEAPFFSTVTNVRVFNKSDEIDLFNPPFYKVHPAYMNSVIAYVRSALSQTTSSS